MNKKQNLWPELIFPPLNLYNSPLSPEMIKMDLDLWITNTKFKKKTNTLIKENTSINNPEVTNFYRSINNQR